MYKKIEGGNIVFLSLYVDDIPSIGNSKGMLSNISDLVIVTV